MFIRVEEVDTALLTFIFGGDARLFCMGLLTALFKLFKPISIKEACPTRPLFEELVGVLLLDSS